MGHTRECPPWRVYGHKKNVPRESAKPLQIFVVQQMLQILFNKRSEVWHAMLKVQTGHLTER